MKYSKTQSRIPYMAASMGGFGYDAAAFYDCITRRYNLSDEEAGQYMYGFKQEYLFSIKHPKILFVETTRLASALINIGVKIPPENELWRILMRVGKYVDVRTPLLFNGFRISYYGSAKEYTDDELVFMRWASNRDPRVSAVNDSDFPKVEVSFCEDKRGVACQTACKYEVLIKHVNGTFDVTRDIVNREFLGSTKTTNEIAAQKLSKSIRLYIGLCLYIQAFPDCIVSGPPLRGFRRPNKHPDAKKSFTVRETRQIRECPNAHWRTSHFRCLLDERFKRNKDGSVKVVFVNSCMVNSRNAYTAIEPSTATHDSGR